MKKLRCAFKQRRPLGLGWSRFGSDQGLTHAVDFWLLSGLEVLVLEKQKYQQLDGFNLRTGRKLFQGRACNKDLQSDGSIRYTACSSKAVWKMLGLCPSQLELRVRRLQWYQQLAANINTHICILMAMFGRLGFDDVDTVGADGKIKSSASPWALQFQEDVQALAAIDDKQSLLDRLQGCMVLVFTQYSRDFVGRRLHPTAFHHEGGFHHKYSMMTLTMSPRILSFVIVHSRMEGHVNKVFRRHKLWRCTKARPRVEHTTICPISPRFRLQTNVHGARVFSRRCYRLETIFGERWEGVIVVVLAVMSCLTSSNQRACNVAYAKCALILWKTCWIMFPLMLYCRLQMQQHRATSEPSALPCMDCDA